MIPTESRGRPFEGIHPYMPWSIITGCWFGIFFRLTLWLTVDLINLYQPLCHFSWKMRIILITKLITRLHHKITVLMPTSKLHNDLNLLLGSTDFENFRVIWCQPLAFRLYSNGLLETVYVTCHTLTSEKRRLTVYIHVWLWPPFHGLLTSKTFVVFFSVFCIYTVDLSECKFEGPTM